ncbi:hypothetical protein ACROYT_G024601 [Oculina patagonica]
MRVDHAVLCLLFGAIFTAVIPIQAEEFHCPSNCHCSTGFIAIKCPGMDEFPVFDFAASVRSLDLSRGHITYINRNNLKAYQNLERLFIDDNPWSCDSSTFHVLQMELIALVDKNWHLDNFDGGKIKCADPPDMKGKRPLLMINSTVRVYHVNKENKGDSKPDSRGGLIALVIFMAVLLLAVICRVAWVFKDEIHHWIMKLWKSEVKSNQVDMMESGKIDNRKEFFDSMKKRRRMSKGIPAADTSTSSDDDDNGKVSIPKESPKDKVRKQKRQSRGAAKGAGSSSKGEGRGLASAADPKDLLKDKMRKQRRQSQGFAAGDRSSDEGESGPPTSVDPKEYLKDKMRKQRRQSCGIAAGDCSSGEESGFITIDLNFE